MTGPDGLENIPHREWLIMFDQAIQDVKSELKRKGREDEFIGAKVSAIVDPESYPNSKFSRRVFRRLFTIPLKM